MNVRWAFTRVGVATGVLMVTVALAACGSSSNNSSSATSAASSATSSAAASGTTTGTTTTALPAGYSGPESHVPTGYGTPKVKPGFKFVVGYLNPNAGVASLLAQQKGVVAEAKALGGKAITYNAVAGPQAQAADFKDLITQGVNAIVVQPQSPLALSPLIKEAEAKHIVIIASNTPADAPSPNLPGYDSDILQGTDVCAYEEVKTIKDADPHAKVVAMGTSLPFPSLQYLTAREIYWAKKLGLDYLGRVDTSGPTPAEAQTAQQSILARYPSANAVMAWFDIAAEAAVATNRASGKTSILVTGQGGDQAAIDEVKAGELLGTCKNQDGEIGTQAVMAAYDQLTKQHLPLPKKVSLPPIAVTKANASSIKGF